MGRKLLAISTAVAFAILIGCDMRRTSSGTPTTAPSPATAAEHWTPSTQSIKTNDAQIWIVSAKVGTVPLKNLGDSTESEKEHLIVTVGIKSVSATKKIDYQTWASNGVYDASPATLKDETGNSYKRISFGIGAQPIGQAERGASVYPGKTITDVLVFEPPVGAAKELRLELPRANIGGGRDDEPIRFSIPSPLQAKK
jgi:hypothetical protein